ncbi:MAG: hypothetical protein GXP23_11755, partial [Gammaproteobacteria bacterium]|nr:hypothetical protein [Gammaproteobacteria bacterium]
MNRLVKLQILAFLVMASVNVSHALTFTVTNEAGEPLPQVMFSRYPLEAPPADLADNGYAPNGVTNQAATSLTRFTNAQGVVTFDDMDSPVKYRARAQGYVDAYLTETNG